jgi:hypothetical protein
LYAVCFREVIVVEPVVAGNTFLTICLRTWWVGDREQATARAKANTGISPLRRAMKLRGSGRDDVFGVIGQV